MSTNAIFKVTNGTDTVDLLADATDLYGFHIESWKPAIAEYKNGGVWRDSPLAHGRRIAGKYFANVIETMTLAVHGYSADDVAARLSDLRQLLEQASDYWIVPYSNTPVWVIARAKGETNTRYALLYAGRITEDNNPYASPFLQPGDQATMVELPFTFERGHWASSAPGERECAAPLIPVRKSFVPTESGDDAFVITGSSTISTTGTGIVFGNAGGTSLEHLGIRFKNISIPKEAKILSAHICFEAASSLSTTTVNARIYGEKTTVPAIFSTYANFVARTLTTSYATWGSVIASTINQDFVTPDLSQVIQEIVDQDAWDVGKNLVIFVRDNGSSSGALRNMASYEHLTAHEPILVVTWMGDAADCESLDYPYGTQLIVTNKRNRAQLTGFYYYDVSTTTFSNNLLNTTTYPYAIDGGVGNVSVGDIWYFQAGPPSTYSGPFNNLIFDFGDENLMEVTVAREYWNGATWASVGGQDYTGGLSEPGRLSMHWQPNSAWVKFDMGSLGGTNNPDVEGYTIRARVTAVVSAESATVLSHPYTVLWPFVEFSSLSIPGDLPALMEIETRFRYQGGGADFDWILMGIRSLSRGNDFDAYLNASDEQHPFGLTVTAGTNTIFAAAPSAATGIMARCSFGTTTMQTRVTFTFSSILANQYVGRFRVFLLTDSAPSGMSARLSISLADETFSTETVSLTASEQITDLGILDLSATEAGDTIDSLIIALQMAGAVSTDIRGLVLMPTDEYSAELGDTGNIADTDNYLDFDSVRFPKFTARAVGRTLADDNFSRNFRAKTITPGVFQVNSRQRLFFLTKEGGNLHEAADAVAIAPYKLSRYFGLRGRI